MRAPSLLQILIIVLIIVLLFGARRLPDLARSVGKSLKIFKSEVTDLHGDDDAGPQDAPASSHSSSTPATSSSATSTAAAGSTAPPRSSPSGSDNHDRVHDTAQTPAEGGSTRDQ